MNVTSRSLSMLLALLLLGSCSTPRAKPTPEAPTAAPTQAATPQPTPAPTPTPTPQPTPTPAAKLVVIDPGHQRKRNGDQEPVGPGASKTKAKVSSGTQGRFSRVPEYQVVLDVSLQLRDELQERGYQVLMTRESNDVNISNVERATLANEAGADAYVRIHCNGSEDPKVHGALTICPTKDNPYPVGEIYDQCYSLADNILQGLLAATGANDRGIWETDTMSGINWSQVPNTIVEMGYMTNEAEDWNLVDPAYQAKLVQGIANGVDSFFAAQNAQ